MESAVHLLLRENALLLGMPGAPAASAADAPSLEEQDLLLGCGRELSSVAPLTIGSGVGIRCDTLAATDEAPPSPHCGPVCSETDTRFLVFCPGGFDSDCAVGCVPTHRREEL